MTSTSSDVNDLPSPSKASVPASTNKNASSMTLSINRENAERMRIASCQFNETLEKLKSTSESKEAAEEDIQKYLIPAVNLCDDEFVKYFLTKIEDMSDEEKKVCLLLFLDMSKSSKLLTAFHIVGKDEDEDDEEVVEISMKIKKEEECHDENNETNKMEVDGDEQPKEDREEGQKDAETKKSSSPSPSPTKEKTSSRTKEVKPEKKLSYVGMLSLFKCFLTSISTCLHKIPSGSSSPNKSQSSPKKLSPEKSSLAQSSLCSHPKSDKEIQEIAIVATDRIMDYVTSQLKSEEKVTKEENKASAVISFETFGDWYNSGGFELVPWVEMLDLSKWNQEAKARKNEEEREKQQQQQQKVKQEEVSAEPPAQAQPQSKEEKNEKSPTKPKDENPPKSPQSTLSPPITESLGDKTSEPSPTRRSPTPTATLEPPPKIIKTDPPPAETRPTATTPPPVPAKPVSQSSFPPLAPVPTPPPKTKYPPAPHVVRSPPIAPHPVPPHPHQHVSSAHHPPPVHHMAPSHPHQQQQHPPPPPSRLSSHLSHQQQPPISSSYPPPPLTNSNSSTNNNPPSTSSSRSVVSFDFTPPTASSSSASSTQPFHIAITEENLHQLTNLVHKTGLDTKPPSTVCDLILRYCHYDGTLHRDNFARFIRELIPNERSQKINKKELHTFSNFFSNFFTCFDFDQNHTVVGRELAIGFSFLCSGNKSTKLSVGFELLDTHHKNYLQPNELIKYLRSYLTMLVGISFLTPPSSEGRDGGRITSGIYPALQNGARWTQDNLLKHLRQQCRRTDYITFESFATWYTEGGYTVAPWLELLDLTKFTSLLSTAEAGTTTGQNHSGSPTGNMNGGSSGGSDNEILFTFPLANDQRLVVQREDALYVRTVVKQLGLLVLEPEEVWNQLLRDVRGSPNWSRRSGGVDQRNFVRGMEGIIQRCTHQQGRVDHDVRSIMVNFYQSFDLEQIDRVPMNQLMGGLTLLCGGRKSSKLAFAFGLFDESPKKKKDESDVSLNGQELFLFLRSYLIVLFSCCAQSLHLSADCVGKFISDTSHMVRHDVMKHQWYHRELDCVSFDEFGEWYNEGGFETAPWLELLDLNKWVLLDKYNNEVPQHPHPPEQRDYPTAPPPMHMDTDDSNNRTQPYNNSSTKTEDNFFPDQMDWTQDGDIFNSGYANQQRQSSPYRSSSRCASSNTYQDNPPTAPVRHSPPPPNNRTSATNSGGTSSTNHPAPDPLNFHLLTNDDHGGYVISIPPQRSSYLRKLITDSGLSRMDTSTVCNRLLSHAERFESKNKHENSENDNAHQANDAFSKGGVQLILTKERFDQAVRGIIAGKGSVVERMSPDYQRKLSDLLTAIFGAFDREKRMTVDAYEFACGFSILCGGRKSDKLEYAFDLLDEDKDGNLSRRGVFRYLRSFLTVLMSLSSNGGGSETISLMNGGSVNGNSSYNRGGGVNVPQAVDAGSAWATDQVFNAGGDGWKQVISFDDFAEWYTRGGYGSIPWLELLDLRKWVMA